MSQIRLLLRALLKYNSCTGFAQARSRPLFLFSPFWVNTTPRRISDAFSRVKVAYRQLMVIPVGMGHVTSLGMEVAFERRLT